MTSTTTSVSIPDVPDSMMLENDSVSREPRHGISNPQPNLVTNSAALAAANVGDMVNAHNNVNVNGSLLLLMFNVKH